MDTTQTIIVWLRLWPVMEHYKLERNGAHMNKLPSDIIDYALAGTEGHSLLEMVYRMRRRHQREDEEAQARRYKLVADREAARVAAGLPPQPAATVYPDAAAYAARAKVLIKASQEREVVEREAAWAGRHTFRDRVRASGVKWRLD
jgi:hypothetical protein